MTRPLRVGDEVPAFAAADFHGRVWTRDDIASRPAVIFFYPRDETPGCVAETCAFRDAWEDFRGLDVQLLGVSRDDAASHERFAAHRCLPYPLLCDADGAMHAAFGATMMGLLPRRVSYLVGRDGRIAAVFDSHLRPEAHAERMLEAARAAGLARQGGSQGDGARAPPPG